MAEWHIYASGPNKVLGSKKYWSDNGTSGGRNNVKTAIKQATDYTNKSDLLTYLGAWMPQDNENGSITESEAINFARFFVAELGKVNIPWSLNALDNCYSTKNKTWLTGDQEIQKRKLNMSMILDNIRELMPQILRTYCRRI